MKYGLLIIVNAKKDFIKLMEVVKLVQQIKLMILQFKNADLTVSMGKYIQMANVNASLVVI